MKFTDSSAKLTYSCVIVFKILSFYLIISESHVVENSHLNISTSTTNSSADDEEFDPYSPLVKCSYLSNEFLVCENHGIDLKGNTTAKEELGYGCVKFGGQKYEKVERSRVMCKVLDGIECFGERTFLSLKQYPCIKYTGHYFVNTLIYSFLLGFLGMDRFCLGHTGTAVGKLLTLGGLGVWWVVDIILLVLGELNPADDSNWVPIY
ncbi:hypothetical protein HELRODRAFT_64117 [Helobdella robusta]|uniref:TM2 domain-containing protein n=1 Tax=Helobdella robusta TaxID=6412 RepID=T1FXP7_HELRO|nr:hypothetical protein HELRODRAFT_64117 [Helobdella robusta]ESO06515.1 hypothetical protein HELRODRAFT_64117 [Helobdella robusta]